jgi:hypothetical protein
MRWLTLSAVVVVAAGLVMPTLGQVDPNQNPVGNILQQLQDNMNNAGVTPQDIVQTARQQMQDGTFDPQSFTQQLQNAGIINQGMLDQIGQARNQFQQRGQQQQMASLQVLLNSPDDEWAILSVKIQRVMELNADLGQVSSPMTQQRNVRLVGGQGQGAQGQQQGLTPFGKALADLQNLLRDPNSSESEVAAKLALYREARHHVESDLNSARADLLAVVTLRQEAILLNMDVLY